MGPPEWVDEPGGLMVLGMNKLPAKAGARLKEE
jgi:hypothetical protein